MKTNDHELIKSYINDKKQVDLLLQTLQNCFESTSESARGKKIQGKNTEIKFDSRRPPYKQKSSCPRSVQRMMRKLDILDWLLLFEISILIFIYSFDTTTIILLKVGDSRNMKAPCALNYSYFWGRPVKMSLVINNCFKFRLDFIFVKRKRNLTMPSKLVEISLLIRGYVPNRCIVCLKIFESFLVKIIRLYQWMIR